MSNFSRIVEVRSKRLDRARRELVRARSEFRRAGERAVEAQEAVDDFFLASHLLEIQLLTSVLHTSASRDTLLMIEEELRKADEHAKLLAGRLADAKRTLNAAGQAAEAAALTAASVEKRLKKSKDISDEIRTREVFEAGLREEIEMEEIACSGAIRTFLHGN